MIGCFSFRIGLQELVYLVGKDYKGFLSFKIGLQEKQSYFGCTVPLGLLPDREPFPKSFNLLL